VYEQDIKPQPCFRHVYGWKYAVWDYLIRLRKTDANNDVLLTLKSKMRYAVYCNFYKDNKYSTSFIAIESDHLYWQLYLFCLICQIVVGSFMPNGYKAHKRKHHREHTVMSPISGAPDMLTAARPISQSKPDGETFSNPTPLQGGNHAEPDNGTSDKLNTIATSNGAGWNVSEPTPEQRPYPDINVSACGE
jgi:hypothetical protein